MNDIESRAMLFVDRVLRVSGRRAETKELVLAILVAKVALNAAGRCIPEAAFRETMQKALASEDLTMVPVSVIAELRASAEAHGIYKAFPGESARATRFKEALRHICESPSAVPEMPISGGLETFVDESDMGKKP